MRKFIDFIATVLIYSGIMIVYAAYWPKRFMNRNKPKDLRVTGILSERGFRK